ncbi:hypothetical protein V8G54_004287 [Vigna mungo]|uniref:Cytochrome P450 n=1 Tax=Vigna mungo TaxID=3915 RepID=A0AAQ3SE14_VIGMU
MVMSSFSVKWSSLWLNATNLHPILTLLLTLITVLWLLRWFRNSTNEASPLPPGPTGLPFLGYLPFLGTHPHLKFHKLAQLYGPIYKLTLGTKTVVVVSSPSLVKEIVRDQDTIFANREPLIAALVALYGGTDIASLPHGPQWRKARKILVREMLSSTNLTNSFPHRRVEVKKSIRYVYQKKIGCPINVGDLAFLTATNAIMSMIWGETLEGEEGAAIGVEFRAVVSELMVLLGKPNVSDLFPALALLDLQGIERRTRKVSQWIDRLFDSAIEKRMTVTGKGENNSNKDFLQVLMELTKSDSETTSMTMKEIKAILIDIVVGGTDTTSTTLEWVVAELMQHPEAMERVHEEMDTVIGLDNGIELESQLFKLEYLEAVIKETLRLHPPLPFLVPRCPSQTSTVGGYTIPKGAQVFLNVWTIQRDPDIWEDALEFRPERFLSDDGKLDYWGNKFEYLPFGSGRRICAGLPLAEKMIMFMLASFLHYFQWRLPSGKVLEFSGKFGATSRYSKA